jgi:agmatine deiminase
MATHRTFTIVCFCLFLMGICSGSAMAERTPDLPVRMCAEWEPASATLIRWPLGIPTALVVELAADDSLYVLVENQNHENQARSSFQSWGINLDFVRFVRADTYSHWTRDWGPHSMFDGSGEFGITDPYFDGYPWEPGCNRDGYAPPVPPQREPSRGWEEDDAVNAILASELGSPLHEIPAYCTGGNIMVDGHGLAYSTRRMYNENAPLMSELEFRNHARDYLGIEAYHFLADPEIHGIQHIDCYAKLLDEETVMIKQVALSNPEYQCIEDLVAYFESTPTCFGRDYTIHRVYCGAYAGYDVAAYTNSLILNRKVLVPLFGISTDSDALASYADAMPGYEILGFYYGNWYYYDALHCRTMGIFDRHMLRISHVSLGPEVPYAPSYRIETLIDDRSELGLIADSLTVRWRVAGETTWERLTLTPAAGVDSFYAEIPALPPETTVEYYLTATDESGRTEHRPIAAPEAFYSFTIELDPAAVEPAPDTPLTTVEISPSPFSTQIGIFLSLSTDTEVDVTVVDVSGRIINQLIHREMSAGAHRLQWNGTDHNGNRSESGIYFIKVNTSTVEKSMRCIMLK